MTAVDSHIELLSRLAQPAESTIVLLVLDGVGDIRTPGMPTTALELASTPNLDALARRSALGRITPVATGITPGSGPGHLALFGFDPLAPAADVGRGAFEALGMGVEMTPGTVVARGNFATVAEDGTLVDRRAGRIPTAEGERLCGKLENALAEAPVDGVEASVHPGEAYRFVLRLVPEDGVELSPEIEDTDPQRLGVEPEPLRAREGFADDAAVAATLERLEAVVATLREALADEEQANAFLLRGFASAPEVPDFSDLYGLRAACAAGYPLYRGVARAVGMEILQVGKADGADELGPLVEAVAPRFDDFDFLFLHVKGTDRAGEDGDVEAKQKVIEAVDRRLPDLLELLDPDKDVLAVTGDHSTPAPMRAHSWHPVPLLVAGPHCFADPCDAFNELQATTWGHLGTFPARELLGLLMANAGRLEKFGA